LKFFISTLMKKSFILLLLLLTNRIYSQTTNDVLNVLVSNKSVSRQQADSLRADAAVKQQKADSAQKSFWVSAARTMRLTGFTQLRYQLLDEAGKNDGFDLRRARLRLIGDITPVFG
jgi:phosphate-selective porin OprO and OprP